MKIQGKNSRIIQEKTLNPLQKKKQAEKSAITQKLKEKFGPDFVAEKLNKKQTGNAKGMTQVQALSKAQVTAERLKDVLKAGSFKFNPKEEAVLRQILSKKS